MKNENLSFLLSIISGIFLILSGTNGVPSIEFLQGLILNYLNLNFLRIIFFFLTIIASLGGFSVVFGGFFIYKKKIRTGRFLLGVGSGAGIISLILNALIFFLTEGISVGWLLSFSTIGVVLSVIAGKIVKPKKLKII